MIYLNVFLNKILEQIHLNVSTIDGDWKDDNRILALVEYNKSFALFVLISAKLKPTSISDLSIETVIPIDQYFSCGELFNIMTDFHLLVINSYFLQIQNI